MEGMGCRGAGIRRFLGVIKSGVLVGGGIL